MREFAADIGNTRAKWGECDDDRLSRTANLPLNDTAAWEEQLRVWQVSAPARWTIAGSNPTVRDRLADWLRGLGHEVRLLAEANQLQLRVLVPAPNLVGIDRLLNAVAVLARVPRGQAIVVINAGTAVTVDALDAEGAYRGGAILPGYRLMAKALNAYTACLPLIDDFTGAMSLPPIDTITGMKAGIVHAVHGGIDSIVRQLAAIFGQPRIFVSGGDASLLADLECRPQMAGPFLTLEGVCLARKSFA